MRLIGWRGAPRHAPENTRPSLLAAYAAGADVLAIDVRMTADGHLVLAADSDLSRLTGGAVVVETSTLAALKLHNLAATFRPEGSPDFHYYDPAVPSRRVQIDTLPELIDVLPDDAGFILTLLANVDAEAARLLDATVAILRGRLAADRAIICVGTADGVEHARSIDRALRIVTDAATAVTMFEQGIVDGVMLPARALIDAAGEPTQAGKRVAAARANNNEAIGAVVVPEDGLLTAASRAAFDKFDWIWGATSESLLAPGIRTGVIHLDTNFAGKKVDTANVSLGYAKANRWCNVHQDDGIHIEIASYDGPLPQSPDDPLQRRLAQIEDRLHFASRDWPYYSGGGVGTVKGIRGDFSAETEYRVATVAQATTLEMAVLNVDPGAHQPNPPTSFRQKASFYDPHGAPPYVGVEHDEDDGFRINWNLGSEYDNNQYGKPVGDGRAPRGARLRLDRRGAIFSAYYRDPVDAEGRPLSPGDWVCVGVARNETLNETVFLRCVGKRWLQEREDKPDEFMPLVPNHFEFMRLKIVRHL